MGYLKTGWKLFLLSVIFSIVSFLYNLLLLGIAYLFGFKDSWTSALSNPFFLVIFIIFLILYILSVVWIGGRLARMLWGWK